MPTSPASAISFSRSQMQSLPGRLAGIGAARRLVGRALEVGVAEAAIATREQHEALADRGDVGDQRLAVLLEDLGAGGDLQHHIGAAGAGAVAPHAVHACLGLEMLLVAVVDQGVQPVDALDHDVAAAAAITAVRAAELDELGAMERHGAGTAGTRLHIDLGLIEELHRLRSPPGRREGSLPHNEA